MLKFACIAALSTCSFSIAAPYSRTTRAWLSETDPSGIVQGVHLLSGRYCFHAIDYVVPGPTPIYLERHYNPCSGTEDGFRYFDWQVLSWYRSDESHGGSLMRSFEPSGSAFLYKIQKHRDSMDLKNNCLALEFHSRENCCGLTNTGGGEISGKNSLVHRTAHKDKKLFRINLPDGTERKFMAWAHFVGNQLTVNQSRLEYPDPKLRKHNFPVIKIPQRAPLMTLSNYPMCYEPYLRKDMHHHDQCCPPPFEKESNYCLEWLEHPNGNATNFAYTNKMEVARVSTFSRSKKKLLSSVTLKHGHWSSSPSYLGRKKLQVSTSDDKTFIYHIRPCEGRMVLDHVEGPGLTHKQFEYTWIKGKPLITKISAPNNRVKEFEFYQEAQENAGKVKAIREPAGPNGAMIATLTVNYPNGNVAITSNSRNNKTLYQFSKEFRLESVTRYIGDVVKSREEFAWGGEWNTQLTTKLLKDKDGKILSARCLAYDNHGNVVIEQQHGCLVGAHQKPIQIENKSPAGGDIYTIKRTYKISHGKERIFNLLASEENSTQLKHTYTYKPDTNLLTEKSHFSQNQLTKRETFDYDDDAICIHRTLESEGTSYTTKISPRQQQPGLAMPETIRQTITTPQGKKTLSTKKITYGTWHKPIKEEFFDREGAPAYTLTYTYDDMGNLSSATNALGHTTHYRYDANKNLIEEILPQEDYRVIHTYDLMNRLTATTQTTATESFTTTYTYDTCGNRTSSTDHQGYTTRYEYDELSRLIKKISPPTTDSDGNTLTPTETYTYNALDQITSITHPDGTTTTKTYTTRGTPTYIKHPDGTEERFTYRLDGKLETHKNTLGVTTTYTYDAYDNICHTKATDPSGALLYETSDTYNAFHHLSHNDACGITTTYTYNAYGQLEREETQNTDGYTTYGYDTLGRQTSVHHYVQNSLQYSEYKTYDLANQVTATWTETPSGNVQSKTTTTYDALGRPTSTTTYGENGPETTYTTYDILGRLTTITDPLGDKTSITYHFQIGPATKLFRTTTTDSLGRQTNEFYDGCGHLRQITKYASSGELILSEKRHYDAMGNLTHQIQDSLSDAPPFTLHQTYGPNSQLLSTTEAPNTPYAKKTTYNYNNLGLLKTKTKPDGVTLSYIYDALGRTASLTTPNISYRYTYDNAHRLTQVKDARGKTLLERSYNTLGNLTKDSYGVTLHHTYDACERQLSTTLPDQTTITYAYDGPNLHSSSYKDYITTITSRDPSNRITAITLANGETVTKAYDPCGRLISISDPYFSQKNTYDTWGRLTSQSTTDPIGTEQTFFNYDDLNQLLTEENSTPQTYRYDALHNRTSHNNHTTSHNPLNQIASSTFVTPTYNKCGHLTRKETLTETLSYTYDDLDRLTKITGEGFSYDFTYDPLDRRVTESYTSETGAHCYTFLYDGQCEIGAVESNQIIQLRVPLESVDAEIGGSHLFFLNSEPYYPSYDHRGNLTVLSKDKPLYTYRYTGFGERTTWEIKHDENTLWSPRQDLTNDLYGSAQKTKTDISPWHFASKRSLPKTGLTSFGCRDYDTSLGRWLIPDPQGFDDGINLYAYVHNSPITNYDAWGLWTGEGFMLSGAETDGVLSLAEAGARLGGADPIAFQDARIQINDWFNQGAPVNYAKGIEAISTGISDSMHALGNCFAQSSLQVAQLNSDIDTLNFTVTKTSWIVALDIASNPQFQQELTWAAAEFYATGPRFIFGMVPKVISLSRFGASRRINFATRILNYSSQRSARALAKLERLALTISARPVAAKNAASIERGIQYLLEHPSQLTHIFASREGHIFIEGPEKQVEYLRLFYKIASKARNWRPHPKQAATVEGVHLFEEKIPGLGKVWAHTREGLLQNGGIEPF